MESNVSTSRSPERLGNDRLLGIKDVANRFGVCAITASHIMDETGRAITLRRKKYILESSLLAYLHERETM